MKSVCLSILLTGAALATTPSNDAPATTPSRLQTFREKISLRLSPNGEFPLNLRGGFSFGSGVLGTSGKGIERSLSSDLQQLRAASPVAVTPIGRIRSPAPSSPVAEKDMIERTIEINATPEEVFQVATRFEKYTEWASVSAIKVLERGRDGLGKSVKIDCGMFGRSLSYTLQYSYQPPRFMSWFATAGSLKELIGSYEFQPLGPGRTRVVYKLRVEPGFYLPTIIKTSTSAVVATAALNNLKRYSELPSTKESLRTKVSKSAPATPPVESTPIWSLSTLI